MKRLFLWLVFCLPFVATAQQYTGMSGLIHTPSADMDEATTARIGGHFLSRHFTPDETFRYKGEKFNTGDFYLSVTPFSWIELGYAFTLRKRNQQTFEGTTDKVGYFGKDRYFSLKLQLLKEKSWYPSIAVGTNDPYTTSSEDGVKEENKNASFSNYYLAATKHLNLSNHEIGFHVAYRHFRRRYNDKWNGLVGGITYSPPIDHHRLRGILEYTGDDINIGADYLLFGHLLMQASLQQGRYFSGGLCYQLRLNKPKNTEQKTSQ